MLYSLLIDKQGFHLVRNAWKFQEKVGKNNMDKWRERRNHFLGGGGGQSTFGACCGRCKDKINPARGRKMVVWLVISN